MAFDAFDEGLVEDEGSAREARRVQRMAAREAIQIAVIEKEGEMETVKENKATFHQYSPMFMLAGLKDLLDLTGFGSLPVIGWIVTACISIAIFFILQFTRTNKHLTDNRFILRRLLILVVGFIIEAFLPGINFFPFEIATVLLIFILDRVMSDEQIEKLTEALQVIHRERKIRT